MNLHKKLINKNDVTIKDEKYVGIDGWLLLPAISILTTPLMLISLIFFNLKMINNSIFNEIFIEYPVFRAAMISQTLVVAMQLVLVIYVSLLFFKKKQALPTLIIAFLTIHLLIIIANLSWIYTVFKEINYSEYSGVTAAIFIIAIGIPYFMKSKRVKETFVNP